MNLEKNRVGSRTLGLNTRQIETSLEKSGNWVKSRQSRLYPTLLDAVILALLIFFQNSIDKSRQTLN